jgi:hypothetical protein
MMNNNIVEIRQYELDELKDLLREFLQDAERIQTLMDKSKDFDNVTGFDVLIEKAIGILDEQ